MKGNKMSTERSKSIKVTLNDMRVRQEDLRGYL